MAGSFGRYDHSSPSDHGFKFCKVSFRVNGVLHQSYTVYSDLKEWIRLFGCGMTQFRIRLHSVPPDRIRRRPPLLRLLPRPLPRPVDRCRCTCHCTRCVCRSYRHCHRHHFHCNHGCCVTHSPASHALAALFLPPAAPLHHCPPPYVCTPHHSITSHRPNELSRYHSNSNCLNHRLRCVSQSATAQPLACPPPPPPPLPLTRRTYNSPNTIICRTIQFYVYQKYTLLSSHMFHCFCVVLSPL